MQEVQFDQTASLLQLFCLIPSNLSQSGKNQHCKCNFIPQSKPERCLEATVQCSARQSDQAENLKHLERLTQLLTLREQQGVGLHLAIQNKESQLFGLHRGLQAKDEEICRLNSKLNKIETEAALRQIMMYQMQSQLNCVWNQQFQKGRTSADKQRDENTKTMNKHQQIVILPEEQAVIQQNYYQSFLKGLPLLTSPTQNSGSTNMRDRSQEIDNLNSQVQKFRTLNQELKRMLNDLEWRYFCMESELEMAVKEKKELKITCDNLESRLFEYESMIHDQMVSIYTLKEKNQWLSQDNIEMIEQMRKKQKEIVRLKDQHHNIKQYSKEESKELRYQIKEIEEEFREVTKCLKMKITEVDQYKCKIQFLEKEKIETKQKLEQAQIQNYELEQSVVQHQQIMEKQSQKIEELTRNTDFLNKKLQEECMLKIIRTKEWEEKYRALEYIIKQKNQQLQKITSTNLEREIQNDRTIEDLQKATFEFGEALKQSNDLKDKMQAQINQWELTSSIKDRTIEDYQRQSGRINLQCAHIQQLILTLQSQLKQQLEKQHILENEKATFQNTVKSMKEIIQQMTIKLAVSEEQLKKSIRNGADLQCESEKNKKVIQLIIQENQKLSERENQLSRDIEKIRSQIKQIHSFVCCQIQSIVNHLEQPEQKDETIQFQILQDNEHYQIIGTEENQLKVIKHKIQQLLSSLNFATAKYI